MQDITHFFIIKEIKYAKSLANSDKKRNFVVQNITHNTNMPKISIRGHEMPESPIRKLAPLAAAAKKRCGSCR